jgi:hypothetical protein
VVSWPSNLEPLILVFFHKKFAIFVNNLLSNRKMLHPQRCVAGTTPATFTGGKVVACCKEVGAEDPFFGLAALCVQIESMQLGPKGRAILVAWGPCCKKANINI